jgi:hypothetical protein
VSETLRDALMRAAELMLSARPHYEPFIVSPRQAADPELMALLKRNYPNGRMVWRNHCDGCLLCADRQATNTHPGTVDDVSRGSGLAQTTTPSGAGPPLGARNADQPPPPAQEQSGTSAGPLPPRT